MVLRAFSNIDFTCYTGVSEIETSDTIYDFFMMTSDMSSADLAGDNQTLSGLAQAKLELSGTNAGYIIVDGNAANNPDALAELDALHAYYNANRDQIITACQQRTAAWAKQAAWNKAHPPSQQTAPTVINFWPIKSSVYLKGANP